MTSSGVRFMQQRLGELPARLARDEPCRAVFDLDNTLFDTRARTLATARQFDAEQGTEYFRELSIDAVDLDAQRTCQRLGTVPAEIEQQFATFWEREFWDAANFVHDLVMQPVLAWVHRAHRAGADVRFLTGRVQHYEQVTVAQLERAGVSFVTPERLHLKPRLDVWTMRFKAGVLSTFLEQGYVAWYLTESRHQLHHLESMVPELAAVLLDCSLERGGPALRPATPVLEAVF